MIGTERLPQGSTEASYVRTLAYAVLQQAVQDALLDPPRAQRFGCGRPRLGQAPGGWSTQEALEFLATDNPDLRFWCQLAGVQWEAVVRQFAVRLADAPTGDLAPTTHHIPVDTTLGDV